MALARTPTKAIVSCTQCGCILCAELDDDGSFTPLGTEDDCACGGEAFSRLR
ncbi:hypothetical protein [Natronorubrum sp. FCH18a]|uniref:hypothetical protein n=1 Tax=Natronorubrum sp. FCH18a TaxID=3447018 RepID=UPI003F50ED25